MEFIDGFSSLTLTLLALICAMGFWFAGPGYNSHSAHHSPAILTSTGIFGTFLGVALGLLHFDTSDIQASVPSLIEGLRTAFWTSIAGLLGALAVKFRHLLVSLKQQRARDKAEQEQTYATATIEDLAMLLGQIRDSLGAGEGNIIQAAIAAQHLDQNQRLEQLSDSMGIFQEQMVEANTRALVTAIEQVMSDFNTQINTQYGDNFKELNEAVGNMLTWQQTYKQELQELLRTQQSNGELLDKASSAYEKMIGHTEVFQQVSDSLGGMLSALQGQSAGLDQYLSQLAQVASKATEGLPSLEGRIDSLTSNLARSINDSQQRVSELLINSAAEMKATSAEINAGMSASLVTSQNNLQDRFEQMLASTEKQVARLDDAMEDELTKALKTFGYQLTSLSEKFVHDYTPLTDKLHELVALAGPGAARAASTTVSARTRSGVRERV